MLGIVIYVLFSFCFPTSFRSLLNESLLYITFSVKTNTRAPNTYYDCCHTQVQKALIVHLPVPLPEIHSHNRHQDLTKARVAVSVTVD